MYKVWVWTDMKKINATLCLSKSKLLDNIKSLQILTVQINHYSPGVQGLSSHILHSRECAYSVWIMFSECNYLATEGITGVTV